MTHYFTDPILAGRQIHTWVGKLTNIYGLDVVIRAGDRRLVAKAWTEDDMDVIQDFFGLNVVVQTEYALGAHYIISIDHMV